MQSEKSCSHYILCKKTDHSCVKSMIGMTLTEMMFS
jgi:hypothetical protein